MPVTSKSTRTDFAQQAARTAASGLTFMRDMLAVAYDYADLYAAELDNADFAGTALEGLDKADIETLVGIAQQIDGVLSGNNGAPRKAVKRLAQFGK